MGRNASSWLMSAKPERGDIFGMMRIVDLCPPSGADLMYLRADRVQV